MDKGIIKVYDGDFAVIKSKRFYENAFANINDGKELTVIIDEKEIDPKDIINIERDWKLITFDTVLDFSLVGFISRISSALAKAGISIFVVSAYSTDHILIKKNNLTKTLRILEDLEIE